MSNVQSLQHVGMKLNTSSVPSAGIARVVTLHWPIERMSVLHSGGDLRGGPLEGRQELCTPSRGIDWNGRRGERVRLRGKPCQHGRCTVGRFSVWLSPPAVVVRPVWSRGLKVPMLRPSSRPPGARPIRSTTTCTASRLPTTPRKKPIAPPKAASAVTRTATRCRMDMTVSARTACAGDAPRVGQAAVGQRTGFRRTIRPTPIVCRRICLIRSRTRWAERSCTRITPTRGPSDFFRQK